MKHILKRISIGLLFTVFIWLLGDAVYAGVVHWRAAEWEQSVERHEDGVLLGSLPYTLNGGSTALLLVHGINDSPPIYRNMAPVLQEQGVTVRVMRLPGFAEPMDQYAQATSDDWVQAVKEEVETLKQRHQSIIIVAHSLGGAVTLRYAQDYQDTIDGVVLLAPGIRTSSHRSVILSPEQWHSVLRSTLLFTSVVLSPFGNNAQSATVDTRPGRTPFTPISVIDEVFFLMKSNTGRAPQFRIPLLMVLGRHDHVVDLQAAEEFYQQWGSDQKELVWMEKAGHPLLLDNGWEDIVKEIVEFVAS